VLSVGVYLAVALLLIRPLGMLGLVLADSAKHFSHALTMLVLTRRRIGKLADLRLGQTAVKALLAALVMAGLMLLVLNAATRLIGTDGLLAKLIVVGLTAGLGSLVYLGLASLMRIDELRLIRGLVGQRLRPPRLD